MSELMKSSWNKVELWHRPNMCHPETCCCSHHDTWYVYLRTGVVAGHYPTYQEALAKFEEEAAR